MKRLTLVDKAFILKSTQLFTQLDLELLLPIADKLNTITCHPGELIFNSGEEAHRLYVLVKGVIEIKDENGLILANLQPQEFFGEEALFHDQIRGYSAICKIDSTLLALSRTHLLAIISESPNVAIGLLNAFAAITPFRRRSV